MTTPTRPTWIADALWRHEHPDATGDAPTVRVTETSWRDRNDECGFDDVSRRRWVDGICEEVA
jgi:hypothetical protein